MPNPEEKQIALLYLSRLQDIQVPGCEVQHGFVRGRSPVTNALAHVGYEYTLCMDLADFFDSVTKEMVIKVLTEIGEKDKAMAMKVPGGMKPETWSKHIGAIFPDGAARQGIPTSPTLANIAAIPMDREILAMQRHGRFRNFIYTRYADDLCFSFNRPGAGKMLMKRVPTIVEKCGFTLNTKKTRLQWAGAGRRMITGVAVDGGIHPTRTVRRRIRAARHHLTIGKITKRTLARIHHRRAELAREKKYPSVWAVHYAGLVGLVEWSKLVPPKKAGEAVVEAHSRATTTAKVAETGALIAQMKQFARKMKL
jgi:hypothetical protein